MRSSRVYVLGLVISVPLVPLTQWKLEERVGRYRAQEDVLYFRSGQHVRRLAPGLQDLMADVYWLRTVQYYGGQRAFAKDKRFDLLRPLVGITTDLDPRLEIAYRYGATFLAEQWPVGAGQPQAATDVLARGVRNLPVSWRLRQDLALTYFFYLKDARRASEILLEASRLPGAPFWMKTLSAEVLVKGGELEASRRLWTSIYEQAEPGSMKDNAAVHLRVLDALRQVDVLNEAVSAFASAKGRRPQSLEELRASGFARVPIVDPAGVRFDYDSETGKAAISRRSPVWRPL